MVFCYPETIQNQSRTQQHVVHLVWSAFAISTALIKDSFEIIPLFCAPSPLSQCHDVISC